MFLAVNYSVDSSLIREDTLDGRDYWVVPIALITEGVHTGNNGGLYYSKGQITRSVPAWNTKPIVVYHPKKDGKHISAASKEVLEKSRVGFILNSRFDDKLRAEAWIDKEKARKVDSRVVEAIEKRQLMEVSTGLFHDRVETQGTWNGKAYIAEAINLQPDHLALLPDEVGACSIEDGAGLLQVNSAQVAKASRLIVNEISQNQLFQNLSKALMQKRSESAWLYEVYDKYFVYCLDGSMFKTPYKQTKDDALEIDFSMTERVQESKTFTPLNVTLNRSSRQMATRNEDVTKLIANSAYTEADREWLTALDDEKYKSISVNTRSLTGNNAPAAPAAPAPAPAPEPVVTHTLQSYIDAAPTPEIKAALNDALTTVNSARAELITAITANAGSPFNAEQLQDLPTATLQGIAAMATPAAPATPGPTANGTQPAPAPNYAGQAPVTANATGQAVTGLALPTMTFGKK